MFLKPLKVTKIIGELDGSSNESKTIHIFK